MTIRVHRQNPKGLIWIASYPRSGNTWTRAFIHALVNVIQNPAYDALDINAIEEMFAAESLASLYPRYLGKPLRQATHREIAAARPRVQEGIANAVGKPIFVKTHNANALDHDSPIINMAMSAGAVYLVRNPLDVAISFAALRNVPVDRVIDDMATPGFGRAGDEKNIHTITGSWTEHVRSWTERPSEAVLVVRYEDLVADPKTHFLAMARHLLMSPTPEQLAKAIDLASFGKMREQEAASGFKEKPDTSVEPFFREGRPGQWRERLTPEQVDRIIDVHGPVMRRFDYIPEERRID